MHQVSPSILIVGAGPVGLTLASCLARAGVQPLVVDAEGADGPHGRAVALHARTLELLEHLDVTPALVGHGHKAHALQIANASGPLARVSFEDLDTPYPFLLGVDPRHTDRLLREAAAEVGVVVRRGVRVIDLAQDDAGVQVALDDGTVTVHDWVVGCDGAQSLVRQAVGIPFDPVAEPRSWWWVDVRLRPGPAAHEVTVHLTDDGLVTLTPLGDGRWRLLAEVSVDRAAPTADDVTRLLAAIAPGTTVLAVAQAYTASIQPRQARSHRSGRVLLAGDAAHVHDPSAGLGMNQGIQDAFNLAWKLALVARGAGTEALLDSYHAERHASGRRLLRGTAFATRAAAVRAPLARQARDRLGRLLGSFDAVRHRMAALTSELALHHRDSPIVDDVPTSLLDTRLGEPGTGASPELLEWNDFRGGPHAGDRAPDVLVHPHDHPSPVALSRLLDPDRLLLLLCLGDAPLPTATERAAHLAAAVRERFGDVVRPVLVATTPPEGAEALGVPLWRDPEHTFAATYGATGECALVLRPDRVVGFRSQPLVPEPLLAHLARVLVPVRGRA